MRISLASSAELYAEHRRTASRRKREKIAAELQRRHDEWNSRPGYSGWWVVCGYKYKPVGPPYFSENGLVLVPIYLRVPRFEFALWLP